MWILRIDILFGMPYAEHGNAQRAERNGGETMAEKMIESFDGTKLFLNKEGCEDSRAVCVIVHGLCEHQGRYDYVAEKMHESGFDTCLGNSESLHRISPTVWDALSRW